MQRLLPLVVSTLTLLTIFARAENGAREVRLSPDGRHFVGWYDHDAGMPFGIIRPIVLRSVSGSYDMFSLVSVPRCTEAEWNSASSMCIISDAPDNGGPNTWLVQRKKIHMSIVEQVRSQKEAVAARHGFNLARMIAAARERQESSNRRIIRQGEQPGPGQPAALPVVEPEGGDKPQPESDGRSR